MDAKLVAWGRAVKARGRHRWPPLWLFTDSARMDDVGAAVAALPKGLCGVVWRNDADPARSDTLRLLVRLCRQRRLVLLVAGRGAIPAGAGRHLRRGCGRPDARWVSSSAHDRVELIRARRAGATLAFLSPAFPTRSHPGAPALGPVRWAATAHGAGLPVLALGGIDGRSVRRLPRTVAGIGAIGALLP